MPSVLNLEVIPTYNVNSFRLIDDSVYVGTPVNPTIEIKPPGFNVVTLTFTPNTYNTFTSVNLDLSTDPKELPDGIYSIKYSITPSSTTFVEKTIFRVDRLQEKFDEAFMQLEFSCGGEITEQKKTELMSIYFYIQSAIASANSCALLSAEELYKMADKLLGKFNCNC